MRVRASLRGAVASATVAICLVGLLTSAGACSKSKRHYSGGVSPAQLAKLKRADFDVVVFVKPGAPPADVAALRAALSADNRLRAVRYFTVAEADVEWKEIARKKGFHSSLPSGSLPSSFRLLVKQPKTRGDVAASYLIRAGVEDVVFGDE